MPQWNFNVVTKVVDIFLLLITGQWFYSCERSQYWLTDTGPPLLCLTLPLPYPYITPYEYIPKREDLIKLKETQIAYLQVYHWHCWHLAGFVLRQQQSYSHINLPHALRCLCTWWRTIHLIIYSPVENKCNDFGFCL